jgi:hypothetical protein
VIVNDIPEGSKQCSKLWTEFKEKAAADPQGPEAKELAEIDAEAKRINLEREKALCQETPPVLRDLDLVEVAAGGLLYPADAVYRENHDKRVQWADEKRAAKREADPEKFKPKPAQKKRVRKASSDSKKPKKGSRSKKHSEDESGDDEEDTDATYAPGDNLEDDGEADDEGDDPDETEPDDEPPKKKTKKLQKPSDSAPKKTKSVSKQTKAQLMERIAKLEGRA